jgi:LEA14-like dessication related protein
MQRSISIPTWRWSLVAALLIGITACRQPQPAEYYGFQEIQFIKTAGTQPTLATIVKMYNPNPYGIELKHADVDVSINGKHVGHTTLDSTLVIPRKDTFYVPVAVQVDLKAILSNVMQTLLNGQATIGLDGYVRIKHGIFTFRRSFHFESKQDLRSFLQSGMGL